MSYPGSRSQGNRPQRRTSLRALAALIRSLSPRRQIQLIGILGLMLVAAAAELVTLGNILPFLSIGGGGSGFGAARSRAAILEYGGRHIGFGQWIREHFVDWHTPLAGPRHQCI